MILSKYFLALDYSKNCSLEHRHKLLLANDFKAYKLKQRTFKVLCQLCSSISKYYKGQIVRSYVIPADYQIKEEIGQAVQFRRFVLMRTFFVRLQQRVDGRYKTSMAKSHYKQKLLAQTLYYLTWAKNQSQIDKVEKVKALRLQKHHSLLVKAFSTLIFHNIEMNKLRQQRRKYKFFRQSICFRKWIQFM